jgi:hypothetical protein
MPDNPDLTPPPSPPERTHIAQLMNPEAVLAQARKTLAEPEGKEDGAD